MPRFIVCGLPVWSVMLAWGPADAPPAGGVEPPPAKKAEVTTIKPGDIYVTRDQEGYRQVDSDLEGVDEQVLKKFRDRSRGYGCSNVYLVWGDDIEEAVRATHDGLQSIAGASIPCSASGTEDKKREGVWMVAFLGIAGSDPPEWRVKSATVDPARKVVRVTYHEGASATLDVCPYYAWVPLKGLAEGRYTLELYDADAAEVVVSRKVTVKRE